MERKEEQQRAEDVRKRQIIGAMGIRDPVGYYGSRQSDDPAERIAEFHFRFPYGHYNPERRYLSGGSPGWPVSGGPSVGKGPKGYRRPDSRIEEDIVELLTDDEWIDASDIRITVDRGEVTLEGEVDTRGNRRAAEDIAWSVPGVTDVQNRLHARSVRERGETRSVD